jgi:asparagine synthase (glutamine-hydrolysing)
MCGIAGIFGADASGLESMVAALIHRGPDGRGIHRDGDAALGHTRLSIIDLSDCGLQPMSDPTGRWWIVFNGEIYNYLELRSALSRDFRTRTDTEVLLAAYATWGPACLERLLGMFAFLVWDAHERRLFAARDRFGVKPLYFHEQGGALRIASEIKALHAAGVPARPDASAWASYLAHGVQDHSEGTFWESVRALPGGCFLTWKDGRTSISRWYDLAERVGAEPDLRTDGEVREEYRALLEESVRLRFRSDVPVGINLSGGLDSSTLLGLVQQVQGPESDIQAFTFVTGDPAYDELPWVEQMLARTRHPLVVCSLSPKDVPALAESVARSEDEPFGGLPTLAYARLFERAREAGVIVLLDGQGMDEQWAGYDYYRTPVNGSAPLIQGMQQSPVRPECLAPELRALAWRMSAPIAAPFPDKLRNLQFRDICVTKIPRALRFNDRVSMRSSTELREPFLDHRLVELALRQPAERKIRDGQQKWLLRSLVAELLPKGVVEAPKRPLQTPQREWLRGPLREWATGQIERALESGWLDADAVRREWRAYCAGEGDNSFFVWQWISLSLSCRQRAPVA